MNETVSETAVVHEVHSHELAHIDEKLDENEESLIRMNSTLEHTVGKIDDIAVHLTGLANSLDRFRSVSVQCQQRQTIFSNLYKKMEGELNLFKINATASMNSFDRTVDLSIDLLDRMVSFGLQVQIDTQYQIHRVNSTRTLLIVLPNLKKRSFQISLLTIKPII